MTSKERVSVYRSGVTMPGNRMGVLLFHSLGGSPIELRPLALGLARAGYTVHCPVIPGLADNTDIGDESTWEHWYATALKAHAEIRKTCDVVIVGGLSVGALLATRLAAERPEGAQGLMLFAPVLWPNGWAIPWYFNFFRLVHQKWFARLFRFRLSPPYGIKDDRVRKVVLEGAAADGRSAADLFGRGGGVVFEVQRLVGKVKRVLSQVRQHTIIFHPRHDDQADLSTTWMLQRKLAGLVEMFVLDDCYHRVTLDRQRTFVIDRVVDYAQRLTQRVQQESAAIAAISRAAAD